MNPQILVAMVLLMAAAASGQVREKFPSCDSSCTFRLDGNSKVGACCKQAAYTDGVCDNGKAVCVSAGAPVQDFGRELADIRRSIDNLAASLRNNCLFG